MRLLLPDRQLFLVDTHINYDPTAEQLAEITIMAAEEMRRFGIVPKAALLSHSNFGSSKQASAAKMRRTLALVQANAPLGWKLTAKCTATWPSTPLHGRANARQQTDGQRQFAGFPNLDAANISYNLLKTAAGGNIAIGPVLLGAAKPVQILTASTTVRRIVNMTAIAVADINSSK
jgi:malate dehydrogenase (oxaloacetate-decarboxylating)(NADP+)